MGFICNLIATGMNSPNKCCALIAIDFWRQFCKFESQQQDNRRLCQNVVATVVPIALQMLAALPATKTNPD
jgi:hypothetical protein